MKPRHHRITPPDALREALAAHDLAALSLMRLARNHLKRSAQIAARIENNRHPTRPKK